MFKSCIPQPNIHGAILQLSLTNNLNHLYLCLVQFDQRFSKLVFHSALSEALIHLHLLPM